LKRVAPSLLVLLAFSMACGPNKAERGLAPSDEESTPESAVDMQKTDQEREKEVVREMQQKQIEEFDEGEKR
jgi:hypothetical protein